MGQRGVSAKIARLIWQYGQTLCSRDPGVTFFVVTDHALREADARVSRLLAPYRECGAVVADAREDRDPVLVTLIRYDRLHLDYSIW